MGKGPGMHSHFVAKSFTKTRGKQNMRAAYPKDKLEFKNLCSVQIHLPIRGYNKTVLNNQKYKVNIISTLDFVLGQHAAKFVGMCNDEESKKWLLSLATLSLIDTPDQY